MNAYSKKSKCPKCGGRKVKATYCEGGYRASKTGGCDLRRSEHIDRECLNCHYEWPEGCLDKSKKPA